jgi:alpha-beta hydrolase superfamily lysophospholipase
MRFLVRDRAYQYYDGYYYKRKSSRYLQQIFVRLLIIWVIAYFLSCIFLYFRQDYIIYRSNQQHTEFTLNDRCVQGNCSPNVYVERNLQLNYQKVGITIPNSETKIEGWWFKAPTKDLPVIAFPNEPVNILNTPKTILYFSGLESNKIPSNSLERIKGFQQLGFSVLGINYRSLNKRGLPNESRLSEYSQAAWEYLTKTQQIAPEKIVIYGEALGGSVAIDLAVRQPKAAGLIVQSSFTSMAEQIQQLRPGLKIFPLKWIIHKRFDSLSKVRSLAVPVLFIHGTKDSIVNYKMSRELYYAAPEPKQLFFIQGGGHLRLYQPGKNSYLLAIKNFISQIDS